MKGLCFHPKRPWILASLHNGVIQLWDYRMGTLLDKFEEHEGPVRGIDFHRTQPLFVSGGDDYKIKVWNFKTKRCLFTLTGHMDYIRTVKFHHEQPWIVSVSDDQTIKIWNWQSRQCICSLTGHNHYVMCAQFHPKDDLIVSASLDQTVRVWDISALRNKGGRPGAASGFSGAAASMQEQLGELNQDLFGGAGDAMVKFILEGHERGVNWATFHPTMPLIVSCADDRTIKLWRYNESRAWEVDTLRGHFNNVSCVLFHHSQDIIISNSEDKTIRSWDLNKRTALHAFRREHDRFWILAIHPEQNLLAAGHDNGLIVFKFERERPASIAWKDSLLYIKDRTLRKYDFETNTDSSIIPLRKLNGPAPPPRFVSFNSKEGYVLVSSDTDGGTWELYQIPKSGSSSSSSSSSQIKGAGIAAVFVGRTKFAVLEKGGNVVVRNLDNEVTKKLSVADNPDMIYQAVTGRVLLRTPDRVHLFDLQQGKIISSISASNVRYTVWSPDMSKVAILSKHVVIICNAKLKQLCSVHETIRIKSGAFDENGVFIYTTFNHMKYCLPNGDNGVVKSLDKLLYVVRVKANAIHFLDRQGKVTLTYIDATEYKFKMALLQHNYAEIQQISNKSVLLGQSIIFYLQQKGYPDVAMQFVKDDTTKFNLALECGDIATAIDAATKLNNNQYWHRLGVEALRQGNCQIVEKAYQQVKDFERLSFLYFITGNETKLSKMLNIAEVRGDMMSRFHNALYLGDAATRVKVLEEAGRLNLAYMTAATYGLTEQAERLKTMLEEAKIPVPQVDSAAVMLHPPAPVVREGGNWPLLNVGPGPLAEKREKKKLDTETAVYDEDVPTWDAEEDFMADGEGASSSKAAASSVSAAGATAVASEESGAGGWETDDILMDAEAAAISQKGAVSGMYVPPLPGKPIGQIWCANSQLAADHVACGSFETAMNILNRTAGIVNFEPLKPLFMSIFMGANATLPVSLLLPPLSLPLQRNVSEANREASLPALMTNLPALERELKESAYKLTTAGKFTESKTSFLAIMQALCLIVVETREEVEEIHELLSICREYLIALSIEIARKEIKEDNPSRSAELAAYFTHCNLQPIHILLSLQSAMTVAFKVENYQTTLSFARRVLDLNPNEKIAQKAKMYIAKCEQKPTNQHVLNYNEKNPFVMCCRTLTPIYRGSPVVRCAYCFATYQPQFKGELCTICCLAEVGASVPGLVSSMNHSR